MLEVLGCLGNHPRMQSARPAYLDAARQLQRPPKQLLFASGRSQRGIYQPQSVCLVPGPYCSEDRPCPTVRAVRHLAFTQVSQRLAEQAFLRIVDDHLRPAATSENSGGIAKVATEGTCP